MKAKNVMLKISDVKIPYKAQKRLYVKSVAKKLGIREDEITELKLLRRALDSRHPERIVYVCSFALEVKNEKSVLKRNKNASVYEEKPYTFDYKNLKSDEKIVIVGSGPAGLFCALMLARAGLCPVVIERGESVEMRKNSVSAFFCGSKLDENSNIQFGEGGAGTFSDGKLTCGVNDIRMDFVKKEFVSHGSPEDIITNTKPHIGTDYLCVTVKNIRDEIISLGGKFCFDTLMTDIDCKENQLKGIYVKNVKTEKDDFLQCDTLVCAVGHSSRDTYEMMKKRGFEMERKPFSIGVRIEHKRDYINKLQYKEMFEDVSLPTADYKLATHPDGRGVYTFCMCPGGQVVAAASENGGVVTNGMSNYARNDENSNSAVLVSVTPDDIDGDDVLGGMYLQREIEQRAFVAGGKNYFAPCQRLGDFMKGTQTESFNEVMPSYKPGVTATDIRKIFPAFMTDAMKKAFLDFERKMKGFCIDDAVLTAPETRSSAPVRILRNDDFESNISGVYPIGEGAGYAGGIMSSAVDGIKCAEKICEKISQKNS